MILDSSGLSDGNKSHKYLFPATEIVKPAQKRSFMNQHHICTGHSIWIHVSLHRYASCDVISTRNPALGVPTRTKKNKHGHHMSEAVFRLKLSAVDRVGSQPVPWEQCVCLLPSHNRDLSADVLIISKCVWNWNRQTVHYVQDN